MNPALAPNDEGVTPEKPWLGLRSFSEEVRGYFFGRESELLDLFERVEHKPLTVFFGRSGLGKTSLLHAGLLPRLRDAGFLPVDLRLRYDDAPPLGQQVIDEIRGVLERAGLPPLPELPPDTSLWLLFHDAACGIAGTDLRFVLIFDQFEEIFTLGDDQLEASRAFRDALAAVVENRVPDAVRERLEKDDALAERLIYSEAPCRVLLSLRDDFLHRLERWRRHMPSLMDNRIELRPLSGPQALNAVVMPGRLRCNGANGAPDDGNPPIVSEETGAAIVRFVAGAAADLPIHKIETVPPLLSLICAELNEARIEAGDATIHTDQLQGKADSILERFYNDCFAEHPPALRKFVEEFLLSKEGYRESVAFDTPLHDLGSAGIARDDARRMLYDLIDRRLLAVEERGNVRRLELTHDVLIGVAKRSRDARHEREERDAREREEDERAKRAQAVADERAQRRKRQLHRWIVGGLLGLAGAAVIAYLASGKRKVEESLELKSKQAKDEGVEVLNAARVDHATALVFFEQGKWREGIAYLCRSLEKDPSDAAARCLWMAVVYGRGERHPWPLKASHEPMEIVCAAADPTLSRVFTASADKRATICGLNGDLDQPLEKKVFTLTDADAKTPNFPTDSKQPVIVKTARFSPDGTRVLIVNTAGRAWVWDLKGDAQTRIPLPEDASVHSAAFIDDQHIVAVCHDKGLWNWDLADPKLIGARRPLDPTPADFKIDRSPIFSADGSRVATPTDDRSVTVWNVATGERWYTVETVEAWLIPIAFSPDSKLMVTMDATRDVRIWAEPAVASSEPVLRSLTRAMPHEADVQAAIFSDHNLRLVTVCGDSFKSQTARVWNAKNGASLDVALDHEGPVCAIAFSDRSSRILTVDGRRTFRYWNPVAGYSFGRPVFDKQKEDDRIAAAKVASPEDDVGLFFEKHRQFRKFLPTFVATNHEHQLVATCQQDTVGIWNESGVPLSPPLLLAGEGKFAGFDQSGSEIVTASKFHMTRLWNLPQFEKTTDSDQNWIRESDKKWIKEFAHAVARQNFADNGNTEPVPADTPLQAYLISKEWPSAWSRLMHWWLEPTPDRPLTPSPKENLTARAVADELLQHLDFKSEIINEVLAIDPTNPELRGAIEFLDGKTPTTSK